ncbi:MAG: hypothetical protein PHY93_09935, partial [Bacteriovorax sp.]|nr:hypothetical protein [Bacteriovorax sp.]
FDAEDIIKRFHRWFREGYMSCTGHCFDIGNTTKASLLRYEQNDDLFREVKMTRPLMDRL